MALHEGFFKAKLESLFSQKYYSLKYVLEREKTNAFSFLLMGIGGKQRNKINIFKNTGHAATCVYLFHVFKVKYKEQLQVTQGRRHDLS